MQKPHGWHRGAEIMEDLNLMDQKNAIAREAGAFLKCKFGFPSESICEQMDNNFLREMRP
jgi:hypothetical protein